VAVQNARTVSEMQRLHDDMQRTFDTQHQLLETIRQLSTPVVPLMEGIILLPLVGHIDSNRARQTVEGILVGVQSHRARVVILDITGVPVVDTMVAQALVQAAQAVHLLGAEAVLVGIMPEVAQTMVGLGIDLSVLVTRANLQSGLEYAVDRLRRWQG
jgi:rsbT co-antagonist protein RsbR